MKKATIIRTIILLIVLLNQVLVLNGKSPLPFNDEQIEHAVTSVVTVIVSLWTFWQNNSFTSHAIKADQYLEELKKNK